MRYCIIILIVLLTSTYSFSQYSDNFIQEDELDTYTPSRKIDSTKKRVFTNIAIGSSVMSNGKNNYSFNTFVNPTISYQMTPRFTVSMGLMAVQSHLNNYTYYNYEGQIQNINYSGTSAYYTLQGAYQLSEKIRVYGGVMVGTQTIDFLGTNIPNNIQNKHRPKAYQIGFEYKIGKHASLQFEFQMRDATPMQNMQIQSVNGYGMMNNSSLFGPRIW